MYKIPGPKILLYFSSSGILPDCLPVHLDIHPLSDRCDRDPAGMDQGYLAILKHHAHCTILKVQELIPGTIAYKQWRDHVPETYTHPAKSWKPFTWELSLLVGIVTFGYLITERRFFTQFSPDSDDH
jgi:hypothetical protein